MIDSFNVVTERLESILPLVAEHNTSIIGLCQPEDTPAEAMPGPAQSDLRSVEGRAIIMGKEDYCLKYIAAFGEKRFE